MTSMFTWFLLVKHEDREETESWSLRNHRPEFRAIRAAGNLGGKTKKERTTIGEAPTLYINFTQILG